jgi:hypothetical protein
MYYQMQYTSFSLDCAYTYYDPSPTKKSLSIHTGFYTSHIRLALCHHTIPHPTPLQPPKTST